MYLLNKLNNPVLLVYDSLNQKPIT